MDHQHKSSSGNTKISEKLTRAVETANESDFTGSSGDLSIAAFIPKEAHENLWKAYFTLSEKIYREFNQRGRLPNREAARRRLLTPNPLYSINRWILLDNRKKAVASASLAHDTELSPDYDSSRHICQLQIAVDPDHRRKKLATRLLKFMLQAAGTMEMDTVRVDADNPTGSEYCKFLKGQLIHREYQHRLYLEDVDWQLVDEWCAKGRSRFPQTRIDTFQDCPGQDIGEFCRIYTEIINQRPVGDIQEELVTTPESRRIEENSLKKREIEWHTMISREDDGQISALTDIMYNLQEPYRVHQYFTGVRRHYRRRGLAKRLKAEMLIYIQRTFPDAEYVTTSTAKENHPMRAINKQLGFVPRKTCSIFQWGIPDLLRRVNRILSVPKALSPSGKKP